MHYQIARLDTFHDELFETFVYQLINISTNRITQGIPNNKKEIKKNDKLANQTLNYGDVQCFN